MSTIKSSNEHLTLNADGSGKDIKFQSNGTEVASISDGGVVTATSYAGSGAALTGVGVSGISSSADATAITIDSSERVGIGTTTPARLFAVSTGGAKTDTNVKYVQNLVQSNESSNQAALGLYFKGASSAADRIFQLQPVELGVANDGLIEVNPDGGKFRAKNGILFGTDTAAANALDDYEEGSWNPAFTGSGGSIGSTNVGEWEGYYTRIGRLVTVQFKITLSNKGSWSGEVRLTGLPYSVQVTLPAVGSCALANVNYSGSSVGNINIYVTAGVTYFRPRYTHDNDVQAMVQVSECTNTSQFQGAFSYITVGS